MYLKWYSLAVPERAHTDAEIAAAQAFLLGEIAAGTLALAHEVGFVVQHRIATMDVFYVCSWNGNNELWETHYFHPLDSGRFEVGRHGTKFPTFCVWVFAIVHHETRSVVSLPDLGPRLQGARRLLRRSARHDGGLTSDPAGRSTARP